MNDIKIKLALEFSISESDLEDGLAEYDELSVDSLISQILDKSIAVDAIDCKVFHAGTATSDEHAVTSGGRVLCVVGLGDSVAKARDTAYRQVKSIDWRDVYFRNDIGHRAIAREQSE